MFVGLDSPQELVRYKYHVYHSYWSYVHQLSYRTGDLHGRNKWDLMI